MQSNVDRIENDIINLAKFSSSKFRGTTRFSYSNEDKVARKYLTELMKNLGMKVEIDGIGNIRAKYFDNNENRPSVMIGSHIDTVANGGKFDGVLGVVAALEVVRVVKENGVRLKHPIEVVIFAEEEGSNFGITLFGSKTLVGLNSLENIKSISNDLGITSYQIIKEFGLYPDRVDECKLRKGDVKAMLELHVEQGGVLESEKISVGIVEAIAGMRTYKISLKGVSNHAGTTPMLLRKDPLVGASEIILHLYNEAKYTPSYSNVATVGKLFCRPNASNIISGEVEFYVDIRDVDPNGILHLSSRLEEKYAEIVNKYNLKGSIKKVGESDCMKLSPKIIASIEAIANKKGLIYKKMNSGAVHDAGILSGITDVGMIFVPSIGGLSHCPEENTRLADIKKGCDVFVDAVIQIANE